MLWYGRLLPVGVWNCDNFHGGCISHSVLRKIILHSKTDIWKYVGKSFKVHYGEMKVKFNNLTSLNLKKILEWSLGEVQKQKRHFITTLA